jgi:membrane dipeptidase
MDDTPEKGFSYACRLLDGVYSEIDLNSESVALASSYEQALKNKKDGLFSVFLGLENGAAISNSFEKLNYLYDKGIRYVTLCHSRNNSICDSCACEQKRWHGLSPFGKELVSEMNRKGILIDVSHASDDSFYDVLEYSAKPVVASHSCCRSLCNHPRNLSDDMIRALAGNGGVVQINFYPVFLESSFADMLSTSDIDNRGELIEREFIADPGNQQKREAWYRILDELESMRRPSYKRIVDHIDHVVSLVGVDHVGIGSDFDGIAVTPAGLEDISGMPLIFEEMRSRGYSEGEIEKVAGANFLKLL